MAASTGSPASRRSTNLMPLTTRPSLTSRQGMTRTLNIALVVSRFRSSQALAAPLMRTSESKGHYQHYDCSAVLDLKFLHELAARPIGTSNPPHYPAHAERISRKASPASR